MADSNRLPGSPKLGEPTTSTPANGEYPAPVGPKFPVWVTVVGLVCAAVGGGIAALPTGAVPLWLTTVGSVFGGLGLLLAGVGPGMNAKEGSK